MLRKNPVLPHSEKLPEKVRQLNAEERAKADADYRSRNVKRLSKNFRQTEEIVFESLTKMNSILANGIKISPVKQAALSEYVGLAYALANKELAKQLTDYASDGSKHRGSKLTASERAISDHIESLRQHISDMVSHNVVDKNFSKQCYRLHLKLLEHK